MPIKQYPAIFRHLKNFQEKAEIRGDKGQHWWELRPCTYYEVFSKPKIIYPDIAKEIRFVIDQQGYFSSNTTYFIPRADWYLLGVLNSKSVEGYFREISAEIRGGYMRFFGQYLETLPIPDAPGTERKSIAQLAQQTQTLHTQRRQHVEQFLRDLGLAPADSNSRNPLEQPWTLEPEEFQRRAKKLGHREPPLSLYAAARDETATLTAKTTRIEREIDERVAALYGVPLDSQNTSSLLAVSDLASEEDRRPFA